MLPEPRESAPVVESGLGDAGELVLGEAALVLGFGLGGVGRAVSAFACWGKALGLGVAAWMGARHVGDHEIGAVWIAGETDGRDPGGALMQQNAEEKQMEDGGHGSMLRTAWRCRDGFAYCFDVCLLLCQFTSVC